MRKRAGGIKTGHAGTLDPLATGVLILALGREATREIPRLMATDKKYLTTIDLSAISPSEDLEKEPQPVEGITPPSEKLIHESLIKFVGNIQQRPPVFSAVNVAGQRAYSLSRKGQQPDLSPRPVTVHELKLLKYEWPWVDLFIHCAKGFYVRSLARDLGEALNTGGYCKSIRRTAVGPFDESMAIALDDVPTPLTEEHLISVNRALEMISTTESSQNNPPTIESDVE